MSVRSSIKTVLPEDVRERLEQKLIASGFSNYQGLVKWLAGEGFKISKSAVHRYGRDFESRCELVSRATEMASALLMASPDDAGEMGRATLLMVQQRLFEFLVTAEDEDTDITQLAGAARAVAEANRAALAVRQDNRKMLKAAGDRAVKAAGSALTPDLVKTIRQAVQGEAAA